MLRIRLFEEAATHAQATAIPGMLHNCIGQEGAVVGACMTLREDDYMTGTHRSHGHPIAKGVGLGPLMAELFGRETGVCRGKGGSMHLAVFAAGSLGESGIVGGAMPAATGAALSATLRGTDQVCLCFFGDGAANCGPFHESLNLASIWKLPVVFFCENNGYAVCTQQMQATSVKDVASRAAAYDIPGVVVDGQDVLAVYRTVLQAVARARSAAGPTLVEAKTYRYCDHLEGLKFPPYRSEEEVASWRERDPITLFISCMERTGEMTVDQIREIKSDVEAEVAAAVNFARESPPPGPSTLYQDLFA